ncbi:hypothetical protein DPMN_099890 [Dreissena polymorpha]|uniref:Uncharacterized protein n=1 Tax=Dreissena polymorpha TaxID=45954 RepID=A0A9D4LGA8_DREPO|nr:hypothetical protein DPMN_099890 [Dreissena polymorpha]
MRPAYLQIILVFWLGAWPLRFKIPQGFVVSLVDGVGPDKTATTQADRDGVGPDKTATTQADRQLHWSIMT